VISNIDALQSAAGWIENVFRYAIVTEQPFFLPNLVLAAVFAAVLALNAVRPRFWCRYLCPLGGLLALISKYSVVSYNCNESACISCQRCALTCPMGAIDPKNKFSADMAECITCLECMEICPVGAISFTAESVKASVPQVGSTRRQFL
jgi:polyferredoxin